MTAPSPVDLGKGSQPDAAAGDEWWAETPLDEMHLLYQFEPHERETWRTLCGKLIVPAWDQDSYPTQLMECLWCLYEDSDDD